MEPAGTVYEDVDVAIVMESTYPYLKGGVSAVVHDILLGNPDLTFGIIHITWDPESPHEDLYGMPPNAVWVKPVYLSMEAHQEDFRALRPRDLRMRPAARVRLAHRLFDAIDSVVAGDPAPLWDLYDEGMNPRTREYPVWALLGSAEFMQVLGERLPGLGLSLVEAFWLMREFFSLACAVLGGDQPKARVYHAHTTGYASLLSAAAARQNGGRFLLTEHNLYVRDTVNTLLERPMALPVTASDWRTFDVTSGERAWMAWWIEMGRFCYPSAEAITYLYPKAIVEAADLGAPVEMSVVIPNGMITSSVEPAYQQRLRALDDIAASWEDRVWRLGYIARVVPIKGLLDLLDTVNSLIGRGMTNIHLEVMGPTGHTPSYYEKCLAKIAEFGLESYVTFHGTVDVKAMLGDIDILVLSSYNEGQPIVVLEAMTAGIPTVGTEVGGMAQLVHDPLTTTDGHTWGPCGVLVQSLDMAEPLADGLMSVMSDPQLYRQLAHNARGRVEDFFQLSHAMRSYNVLYRELGGLPPREAESEVPSGPTTDGTTVPGPAVANGPTIEETVGGTRRSRHSRAPRRTVVPVDGRRLRPLF